MENKHTPGLWEVTGSKNLFIEPINMKVNYNYLFECCQTCNVQKSTDITAGSQIYNPRKIKEAQANARLIAAAPDLLEACKEMMGVLETLDFSGQDRSMDYDALPWKQWEQAIAKAKGGK